MPTQTTSTPDTRPSAEDFDPTARICPVCRQTEATEKYVLSEFTVYSCQTCATVYEHPIPTPDEIRVLFDRLYTEGEGSVPELKSYYGFCYEDAPENPLVQLYETWLARLERHRAPGRLLDVGCGTGLFMAVAKRRGWDPHGIDECAEATTWATDHFGLDVTIGEFSQVVAAGESFDAVTGWDIIEHSRDPVSLLRSMHSVLAPGGIIGLSTPRQHSILDVIAGAMYHATGGAARAALEKFYIEQHFLYFNEDTLTYALEQADCRVAEMNGEFTDLRRLALNPAMRAILKSMFFVGGFFNLENRLFAVARAKDDAPTQ